MENRREQGGITDSGSSALVKGGDKVFGEMMGNGKGEVAKS